MEPVGVMVCTGLRRNQCGICTGVVYLMSKEDAKSTLTQPQIMAEMPHGQQGPVWAPRAVAHGLPHGHDSATPISMGALVVRVGLGLRVGLGSRVGPGSCMGLGSRVGDTRVDLLKKTQ